MITMLPVNHTGALRLKDGAILYSFGKLPFEITSFKACLDGATWRDHHQPFALACVDPHFQNIVLVRDHLGLEPLYYCYHHGKRLIVAQTIPDLLKQLSNTPPLHEPQIDMLFSQHKFYSDETHYQGVYRVEPGHIMHIKHDGSMEKKVFWKLDAHGPLLHYNDHRDYLDHFASLMHEAMANALENQTHVASEFSAGLDSSAIYCAAVNHNVSPKLFMHVAREGSKSASTYVERYERDFIQHFKLHDIQRIADDDFDPIKVFREYATWFAGPAPSLFTMFAQPVHRAVAAGKHTLLLSGFGGDQCVSGQLPLNFVLPELIHQAEYRKAWRELDGPANLKKVLRYTTHMHPKLYAQAIKVKALKQHVANVFRTKDAYQIPLVHPYHRMYYTSAREAECALLQGIESHEVRMRIEYSSIVSKKMGFEYRYPLLYPKLLEFMVSIPTLQKRYDGCGRYLIRQYLANNIPGGIFKSYRKREGLGIVPSTLDQYQEKFKQGCYQAEFQDLPYAHLIQDKSQALKVRKVIKGFMLKTYKLSSQEV